MLTRALQSHKDIPIQLLAATKPLKASVVLASFGSSQGLNTPVFDVKIETDASAPGPAYEKPLRYGKKPEIHHIFRPDPTSPPRVISLVFALAVAAMLPALLVGVSGTSGRRPPPCLLTFNSGSSSGPTSTTSPRPLAPHRFHMPASLALSWAWKLSFSCTISAGICSRRYPSLVWSDLSLCSAVPRRWARFRAGGLPGSAERQLVCVDKWCCELGIETIRLAVFGNSSSLYP